MGRKSVVEYAYSGDRGRYTLVSVLPISSRLAGLCFNMLTLYYLRPVGPTSPTLRIVGAPATDPLE
jgi:hypothetical protein